ncbi:DUF4328 domain-containing protein [Streptomyces sp. NRRL S-646]|uniref:DUF4328 domain-containing protein n=1 Tax=Streptomyces sp. NRRL S-646 TaxID=1463917 RepID=UPI0004CA051A|nr:DUF4328 domain-containing protein [Streptomyces sp. NRRL S-646]
MNAPWLLARFSQAAIAAAAAADVFRALALRAHDLHPTNASLNKSGFRSMVFVYLTTAAAAFFLVWFSRCRRNARVLSPGVASEPGVWAVVAWLIPVVNLWVPRGLVLDVLRASSLGTTEKGRDEVLVNVWWVAWAGHTVIAMASRLGDGTSMPLLLVTEALNLAAAVLVMFVIQRITGLQGTALRAASATPVATP